MRNEELTRANDIKKSYFPFVGNVIEEKTKNVKFKSNLYLHTNVFEASFLRLFNPPSVY